MYFTKEEAQIFEDELMIFWKNKNDKRWFWLGFQALEKSGLTYYENSKEEMLVRERIVLLAVIYYEYCVQNGFNTKEFNDWKPELIYQVKGDFSSNVGDSLMEVTNALIKYFEGEDRVSFELNQNCQEGLENRFFRINEKPDIDSLDTYRRSNSDFWSAIYKYDIDDLMCISL